MSVKLNKRGLSCELLRTQTFQGKIKVMYVCDVEILFPLFHWHACKLAKISDCIAKCKTFFKAIVKRSNAKALIHLVAKKRQ